MTLLDIVVALWGCSRSQARRWITGGGIYVNDVRCTDPEARLPRG